MKSLSLASRVCRSWGVVALFGLALLAAGAGCKSGGAAGGPKGFYNRYNIHVVEQNGRRSRFKASYLNLTEPKAGHRIIPINTLLVVSRNRGGYFLKLQDDGSMISFDYDPRAAKMPFDAYIKLITSPEPVPTDQFGEMDLKGIKDGQAAVGMTRAGVMAALGYPAAHKTPSLDAKTFTYWKDERRSLMVEFDDQGIVTAVK